jgi:hypothetical protein
MSSLVERCACGAKIELTEVHYTQIVSYVRFWRADHKCVSQPEPEKDIQAMHGGESRTELPSAGISLNILPSEEEEERRR